MMSGQSGRTVLIASLSLNLFLVTAFAVMAAWGLHGQGRHGAPPPLRAAALSLDREHGAGLLAVLRSNGRAVGPENRQARALRIEAFRSLEGPNFDPAAAKAMLVQARALNQQATAQVQDSVVDFAATLPPDQRAALGEALAARLPRPPPPRAKRPN